MDSERGESRRLNFNRRMYFMRSLGLFVGGICVGAVLLEHGRGAGFWVGLVIHVLLWPTLAYVLAARSRNPVATEYRNLLVDSIAGGFWIAVMAFDTLPSVLLAVMLTMDKVIVGGHRFSLKAFGLMLLTAAMTSAALGFPFEPVTSYRVMLACLPLLVVYPMAVGAASRLLAQKTLEQKRMFQKISRFDAATGLMNRQQLQYAATVELSRFVRTGRPAVLMMIDIDHFKQINDSHGHTVGDNVIEEFARLMKACLRDMDTGGRYGGDEFGIVMPETSWEEAIVAAERLRRQVAAYEFPVVGLRCTISIGLAQVNPLINSVNDWVTAADAALYAAKRRGRDCIEVARMPSSSVLAMRSARVGSGVVVK